VSVAEAGGEGGDDDGEGSLQLFGGAVGHDAQDPDVADFYSPVLFLFQSFQQLGQ
jgi:hypothetical protein